MATKSLSKKEKNRRVNKIAEFLLKEGRNGNGLISYPHTFKNNPYRAIVKEGETHYPLLEVHEQDALQKLLSYRLIKKRGEDKSVYELTGEGYDFKSFTTHRFKTWKESYPFWHDAILIALATILSLLAGFLQRQLD